MREALLHYIWKFKKFNFIDAETSSGEQITLINIGQHNTRESGPDFFNAKLKIGSQLWVGNVEIHINSSDWYAHHHEVDEAYDNVILHVVWQHNSPIFRKDNTAIPTLELKPLVNLSLIKKGETLLEQTNTKYIPCENDFHRFDDFVIDNWLERLYLERLEEKSKLVLQLLRASNNDWEFVFFQMLAKNFGLNVNGAAFLAVARQIPYNVIHKVSQDQRQLEAILMGASGLLDGLQDVPYAKMLQEEFDYLKKKFSLDFTHLEKPKFFRLRPDNFPNIRLAQLAALYHKQQRLFSKACSIDSVTQVKDIFKISVTKFWTTHYTFTKTHNPKPKGLSDGFVNLTIINTIVPVLFCYFKASGKPTSHLLELVKTIPKEVNSVVKTYNRLRPNTVNTALDSQAILHLKKNYCEHFNCLSCQLGLNLIDDNN